jgi:hypothetical protein
MKRISQTITTKSSLGIQVYYLFNFYLFELNYLNFNFLRQINSVFMPKEADDYESQDYTDEKIFESSKSQKVNIFSLFMLIDGNSNNYYLNSI